MQIFYKNQEIATVNGSEGKNYYFDDSKYSSLEKDNEPLLEKFKFVFNLNFLKEIITINDINLTDSGKAIILELVKALKDEIIEDAERNPNYSRMYLGYLIVLENVCNKFKFEELKKEIKEYIGKNFSNDIKDIKKEEKQKQREELKKKKMGKKGIKLSRKKKKEEYNFKLSNFKNPELTGEEAWRYKFVDGTGDNAFICTYETLKNFSETLGEDVKILVSATNNKGTGEKNYIIIELDKKIFIKLKRFAKKNPDKFRVMNKIEQPNNSLIQRGKAKVQSLWKKTNVIRDGGEQITNTVHGKIKHLISKTKIELKDTLYEMADIMRLEELFKERKDLRRFNYPYGEDNQQKYNDATGDVEDLHEK